MLFAGFIHALIGACEDLGVEIEVGHTADGGLGLEVPRLRGPVQQRCTQIVEQPGRERVAGTDADVLGDRAGRCADRRTIASTSIG